MPLKEQGVVDAVEHWLKENGFHQVNAIPAGARGFDIQAVNKTTGERWLIEAKGGAHSGEDLSNVAWARVGSAFLSATSWRFKEGIGGERFAIAVPHSPWFNEHVDKIRPALSLIGISLFQVCDNTSVLFTENRPQQ